MSIAEEMPYRIGQFVEHKIFAADCPIFRIFPLWERKLSGFSSISHRNATGDCAPAVLGFYSQEYSSSCTMAWPPSTGLIFPFAERRRSNALFFVTLSASFLDRLNRVVVVISPQFVFGIAN